MAASGMSSSGFGGVKLVIFAAEGGTDELSLTLGDSKRAGGCNAVCHSARSPGDFWLFRMTKSLSEIVNQKVLPRAHLEAGHSSVRDR